MLFYFCAICDETHPKFPHVFVAGVNCLNSGISIHLWLYPYISYSTEIGKLSLYFSDICNCSFALSLQLNVCRHILFTHQQIIKLGKV